MLMTLILIGAGFMAGATNAIAGGGTFYTLPALIAAGLPATAANASSTVALVPGTLASAWAYRDRMQGIGALSLKALLIVSAIGGLIGAVLLLVTPTRTFDVVLPWLLLVAFLMLAFGPRLRLWLDRHGHRIGPRWALFGQFLIAIYGGYFGGALGLIMMALWTLLSDLDVQGVAPARTLVGTATNATAVLCFILAGAVWWPQTVWVLIGAATGGYVGARIGPRLPLLLVKVVVLGVTGVTTVSFFIRAYG